jgi:hypothetical protein
LWTHQEEVGRWSDPIAESLYPTPTISDEELGISDIADTTFFSTDTLRRIRDIIRERSRTVTACVKCSYKWKPHIQRIFKRTGYPAPWSNWQIRKIGSNELDVTVTLTISTGTNLSATVNFDGGRPSLSPKPQIAIEGKHGYKWMNPGVTQAWSVANWAAYTHAFLQLNSQQAIASLCGIDHEVYLSNSDALTGFQQRIPLLPNTYQNVGP